MSDDSQTTIKLSPMEQGMMWERMSGERLSDAERARIMQGGEFQIDRAWANCVPRPATTTDRIEHGPHRSSVSRLPGYWTCAVCLSIQIESQDCHCGTSPRIKLTEWGVEEA